MATMPLRQRRLCFRPAVVVLWSGAKTDHGEPMRTRATLAVSPWLFIRWSSLPIRKTSELPDFQTRRPFGRGFRDLYPVGFSSLRRDGDRARQRSRATMLFCNSRLRFCPAGVDPAEWGKQASERTLRGGGISAASALRPPPRTFPCREAKSDVREKRRSRKATFANQLRGVDAFAESPWPLTRA